MQYVILIGILAALVLLVLLLLQCRKNGASAGQTDRLLEQHLRKVEESLTDAIAAAEVAGISNDELKGMLEALLDVE